MVETERCVYTLFSFCWRRQEKMDLESKSMKKHTSGQHTLIVANAIKKQARNVDRANERGFLVKSSFGYLSLGLK